MRKTAFFRVKQPYLPQFSRIFTVRPLFWVISGLAGGILASFILWKHPFTPKAVVSQDKRNIASDGQIAPIKHSYEEWKQVVENRPDYRDGYMMVAWYAQKLGRHDEARVYIQKAIALDPNYSIPEVFQVEK